MRNPNIVKVPCPACDNRTFVRAETCEKLRCSRCGLELTTAQAIVRYGDQRRKTPAANHLKQPM